MAELKVGIISQARMTSTRLPGKVLLTIKQKPILQYHLERLQQSQIPVFIATTTNATDDSIADFAASKQTPVFRGDENHVLRRYYECAKYFNLDVIVRVTSDCPLIDGQIIAEAVNTYKELNKKNLYVSNVLDRTYPRGFDFELFSYELLAEAYQYAHLPNDLEHVTPYINQNKSGRVEFKSITRTEDKSKYRITLDTPEDFLLIKSLIENYQAEKLSADGIIQVLDQNPGIVALNAHIEQIKV